MQEPVEFFLKLAEVLFGEQRDKLIEPRYLGTYYLTEGSQFKVVNSFAPAQAGATNLKVVDAEGNIKCKIDLEQDEEVRQLAKFEA